MKPLHVVPTETPTTPERDLLVIALTHLRYDCRCFDMTRPYDRAAVTRCRTAFDLVLRTMVLRELESLLLAEIRKRPVSK